MRTYYDVLGVARSAALEEIRSAYHRMVRENHPDLHSGAPSAVRARHEVVMREVTEAWTVLKSPDRRSEYDLSLREDLEVSLPVQPVVVPPAVVPVQPGASPGPGAAVRVVSHLHGPGTEGGLSAPPHPFPGGGRVASMLRAGVSAAVSDPEVSVFLEDDALADTADELTALALHRARDAALPPSDVPAVPEELAALVAHEALILAVLGRLSSDRAPVSRLEASTGMLALIQTTACKALAAQVPAELQGYLSTPETRTSLLGRKQQDRPLATAWSRLRLAFTGRA